MLYDVILVGFPDGALVGDSPAAALSDVFGIDHATATRMLQNVPSIVKEGVPEPDARRYLAAFRYIGADARFRAHEESLTLDVATGSFEVASSQVGERSGEGSPHGDAQNRPEESWDVDTSPPRPAVEARPAGQRAAVPPVASDSQMAKIMTGESELTPAGDEFEEWDPWSAESGVGAQFEEAARERLQRTADAMAINNSTNLESPQNRSALLAEAEALARIRAAALEALDAESDAPLPGMDDDISLDLEGAGSRTSSSSRSHVVPIEELPPPPSPGPVGASNTEEISGLGDAAEREVQRRKTSKGLKHTLNQLSPETSGFTSEDAAALMEARLEARARALETAAEQRVADLEADDE